MGAKVGGGGGGKFGLGQNADINVTPFVDVLLVLLIIFMLAIPLATVAVKIDLPPPTPPKEKPKKDPVFINIEQAGKIYIGAREVTLATVGYEIGKALDVPNPQGEQVTVRADRYVQYREFMAVMNELQYNGYFKIGLMTEDL